MMINIKCKFCICYCGSERREKYRQDKGGNINKRKGFSLSQVTELELCMAM